MPQENKFILSIVIPIFNEEKYIDKLFYDIKRYFNEIDIEIIVINDGSTDNSLNILNKKVNEEHSYDLKLIDLKKNLGKGYAVRKGLEISSGKFILLQDADLELDVKDSKELFDIIKKDIKIKCIFGSRYLSGKLKKHNYFMNAFFGKFNTLIFNLFFGQSLSDVHCGLKIFNREILDKIKLSINDFGLEIDIAAQIIKSNYYIYEVGVSYYSRTVKAGKKITWIDGLKSYYYLFKVRFIDNPKSTQFAILTSMYYMFYVGTYFGMGSGKTLFVLVFSAIGMIIGLHTKILSSLMLFLFIYIGSLFGQGQGKVLSVIIFFIIGIYLVRKLRKITKENYFKLSNLF